MRKCFGKMCEPLFKLLKACLPSLCMWQMLGKIVLNVSKIIVVFQHDAEVEGYHGMDMMRELKRRNYEHLKEEFEAGGEAEELETELVTLGEIDVLQNLEIIEDEITGTDPSPV